MKRDIELSTTVRAAPEAASAVLSEDPGRVVAGACSADERAARRFRTSIGVDVGVGGHLEQRVVVEVGPTRTTCGRTFLPVRWRGLGWERMFPAFQGTLEVAPDGRRSHVVLRGAYTVPLGPLGAFGDGIAGRRVARQSLCSFLRDVAGRLDDEVDRHAGIVSLESPSYCVEVRELGSEHYVG